MPLEVVLVDTEDGVALHTESPYNGYRMLETASFFQSHGVFKSVTHTTTAVTAVAAPVFGGSIVLTDMLLSSEKKNAGIVVVTFTDGVNSIDIFRAPVTDGLIAFGHTFGGRFHGWKDAQINFTTVGADTDATLTIGYVKLKESIPFLEWDAAR